MRKLPISDELLDLVARNARTETAMPVKRAK